MCVMGICVTFTGAATADQKNVAESVVYGRLGVTLQRVTSQGDCVVRSLEVVEDKPEPKMASQLLTAT